MEILEDRLAPAVVAPTLTTPTSTGVTPYVATMGGTITDSGGSPIFTCGVVYSLTSVNSNPTLGGKGCAEVDLPAPIQMNAFTVPVNPLTPGVQYSFAAFATSGTNLQPLTGYSPTATFTALAPNLMMPADTVDPTNQDQLNTVCYFKPQPTNPNPAKPQFSIPPKTITITNNAPFTVFPILTDSNSTVDLAGPSPIYKGGGLYDPYDTINNEYRGYIGYTNSQGNFVGLLPGMQITITVPLVFWDGARIYIGTDPTYMDMLDDPATVGASPTIPNPFQYYAYNIPGSNSPTLHAVLGKNPISGAPAGVTDGVVMWYHQAGDPRGPGNDAPAQLGEFTIRDPILSSVNPDIDVQNEHFSQTHSLINYDVSYVDNMALPVAMEALNTPIAITDPPTGNVQIPFPGPTLPYGWVGSAQTVDQFKAGVSQFLTNSNNELGTYFKPTLPIGGQGPGWTQYNFGVTNNNSPSYATPPITQIPSGQDVLANTPLSAAASNLNNPTAYGGFVNPPVSGGTLASNYNQVTSNGTTPVTIIGAGSAFSDGTSTLYLLANTSILQQYLEQQLQVGMIVTGTNVPAGTTYTVKSYGASGDNTFSFTTHMIPNGGLYTVLPVQLTPQNPTIPDSGNNSIQYNFVRPSADYVSQAIVNLWYTWANYYIETGLKALYPQAATTPNVPAYPVQYVDPVKGPQAGINNVIQLGTPGSPVASNPALAPGMVVTGPGIADPAKSGLTTVTSISPSGAISLSQGVDPNFQNMAGSYTFTMPTMANIQGSSDPTVKLLGSPGSGTPAFNPAQGQPTASVPNYYLYAQNAFQLLSYMSQMTLEAPPKTFDPLSVQVVHAVIGGLVTGPTNLDKFKQDEVAYRTMVKSLLRGVNDFNVQANPNLWYPSPNTPTGGQSFNVYNLDPFVWFVHQGLGLSGYGFSLDDDAADIGATYATKLGISIGGLNGLPNQFEWTQQAPYGPVSGNATVLTLAPPLPSHMPAYTQPYQIVGLPTFAFYSVSPLDQANASPAALVSGIGVAPGTFVNSFGDGGLGATPFGLANTTATATTTTTGGFTFPQSTITVASTAGFSSQGGILAVQTTTGYSMVSYTGIMGNSFTGVSGGALLGTNQFATVVMGAFVYSVPPPLSSPLAVGSNSLFAFYGQGTANVSALTLSATGNMTSPYQNTSTVLIPAGINLKIVPAVMGAPAGSTSYTQEIQQLTRVGNTTIPSTSTIVDGLLDVARVDIASGVLAGTGMITGNVSVEGPLSGYLDNHDPHMPKLDIQGIAGGFLMPGDSEKPGKLSIGGDVSLYDAGFEVLAKGAANHGTDYSWLSGNATVNLGNSNLDLSFIDGYVPKVGDVLTIITAVGGVTGMFNQKSSITVHGFHFTITYNAKSVVLTCVPQLGHGGNPSAGEWVAVAGDAGGSDEIKVFNAVTAAPVLDFYAFPPSVTGGLRVALADVNDDSRPDIIVGTGPGSSEIKVFSGVDGTPLLDFYAGFSFNPRFTGGVFVAGGDVNGDGMADIIVGPDSGGPAEVKVFSGSNGAPLYDFYAYGPGINGGVRVAAGDVTGDGFADIITGTGPGTAARVRVFDGTNGSLLRDFYAFPAGFQAGVYVATGDINGDGLADLIVGAGSGAAEVRAFDGDSGTMLLDFYAYDGSFQGGVRVGFTDAGTPDPGIILTSPGPVPAGPSFPKINTGQTVLAPVGPALGPLVEELDSATTADLDSFFAFNPNFYGGAFVGGA